MSVRMHNPYKIVQMFEEEIASYTGSPYAVSVDTQRNVGVSSNQGTPNINASATVFDLCKVYEKVGRKSSKCP